MSLFSRIDQGTAAPARHRLLSESQLELIPLENLSPQLPVLPPGSRLSVTASPVKSLEHTIELTRQLLELGHDPVPHIAARMVEDKEHLALLLERLLMMGRREIFVVAGDAPEPAGVFDDAVQLLEALTASDHDLRHIGVTAYPDGHGFISDEALHSALHHKQDLLTELGVEGHVTTQMCFDADAIRSWLQSERDAGLALPVHLGIPGGVERTKLLAVGARLGVGASLRYLKKNHEALRRIFAPGGYDANKLLAPLADDLEPLGIDGLHIFTFNQLAASVDWRAGAIRRLQLS
ncbi:MAG: methylenetetrahydrofolate reductase [Actinomycetota bacterium]|nr:methylenetetrahydrofolate reductase [Actinomycetota bacterium]